LIIILSLRILEQSIDKIGDPKNITDAPGPANALIASNSQTSTASSSTTTPIVQQQNFTATSHQQPSAPPPGKNTRTQIFPIEGLSPYQNNWMIKARVTQKSEVKEWSNPRGEGKLFNVTLMDESGEIRGTAFNLAVDELYPKFEEGKVYYISKARVNLAKKKFSNLTNDYELSFERHTEVEEVSYSPSYD
jgi:replication factor A1